MVLVGRQDASGECRQLMHAVAMRGKLHLGTHLVAKGSSSDNQHGCLRELVRERLESIQEVVLVVKERSAKPKNLGGVFLGSG